MKRNLLTTLMMATMAMTTAMMVSCDDEEAQYHPPVFSGITFSPNPCHEGDAVTATVTYQDKGENWYYFKQVFELDGTKVSELIKDGKTYMPNPPMCAFTAPAAGTHTVKFRATPSATAGQTLYPGEVSVTATLVVEGE